MTTCLGIRNATHWADTRSIERASVFLFQKFLTPGPLLKGRGGKGEYRRKEKGKRGEGKERPGGKREGLRHGC